MKILCVCVHHTSNGNAPSHNPNKQHTQTQRGTRLPEPINTQGRDTETWDAKWEDTKYVGELYRNIRHNFNGTANKGVEITKEWRMKRNRKHTLFQQITAHDGRRVGEFNLIEEPSRGKSKKET